MTTVPKTQIPAFYHRRIGDILVTAVSDGSLVRTHELLRNVSADEAKKHLDAAYRPGIVISVNCFLIRRGDKVLLVETGSGKYMGDSAGHLLANLALAGVKPADISGIMLTHMHPDHSAGLTDMTTRQAHFPNAELVCHENEPRHWNDDAAMARGTEREKTLFFQAARDQMAPYRNRMRLFKGGEVFPGITAMPFPGHTPGHSGYLIESGSDRLLIWGDTVHIPEVQIPRPEVTVVVDTDPAAAEASRRRVLDMAASERLLVTGMHLHFPGFGHVARRDGGFAFVPEAWQQTL